jgi:hypothetical protein
MDDNGCNGQSQTALIASLMTDWVKGWLETNRLEDQLSARAMGQRNTRSVASSSHSRQGDVLPPAGRTAAQNAAAEQFSHLPKAPRVPGVLTKSRRVDPRAIV